MTQLSANMHITPQAYLPSTPLPHGGLKITAIETSAVTDIMGALLLVRVHTEGGLIGHGETYYAPTAVQSLIHDWMSYRLLGADALAIESHWRFFYERFANFGVRGTELRAISAIDVALWDLLGQVTKQPIYRLLGGPVRTRVPVYNSCGSPTYGRNPGGTPAWPGYGGVGSPGPLCDSYNLFHDPVSLALELMSEGFGAVKTWSFDGAAHRSGGMRISLADLDEAVNPLRKMREAVGDKLEILVDGHGFFMLPAALRIADALRDVRPLWLEDVLKTDNIETLADFRRQSRMPISVSEMLLARPDFARLLDAGGADFVMIDPTWVGGISETARLAHMAQAYNVPSTMHDCTGPLTFLAGVHVNAAVPGCCFQETVRAHVRSFYKDVIDPVPVIRGGFVELPTQPGIGATLNPDLFAPNRPGVRRSAL